MDTQDWTVEDHINWICREADVSRYMNEVKLNVQVTTMAHYMGLVGFSTNHDLVDVTNKYRDLGVIQ